MTAKVTQDFDIHGVPQAQVMEITKPRDQFAARRMLPEVLEFLGLSYLLEQMRHDRLWQEKLHAERRPCWETHWCWTSRGWIPPGGGEPVPSEKFFELRASAASSSPSASDDSEGSPE